MNREEKILHIIKSEEYVPLKFHELAMVAGAQKSDYDELSAILERLENRGEIVRQKKGRYVSSDAAGCVRGVYRGSKKGFGFVLAEGLDDDVFVPAFATGGAMNGDEVLVRITAKAVDDKKREGEVLKVISRANEIIVGVLERDRNFSFVVPDDVRIGSDIFIPKSKTLNAKNKHKVVVKVTKWGDGSKNPEGEVVEILGFPSQPGVDILSVEKRYGFEEEFSEKAMLQAKKLESSALDGELCERTDFRGEKIFTIDGADAKDLDDAVGIKETDTGFVLGVHIADVSHYVTEKSPLDNDAFKRGTSVYFPDRVVPMLPRELSNGICSLNPGEDRLTLSVVIETDLEGNVKSHKIEKGVIKTVERMTYDDVTSVLNGDKDLTERYAHIKEEIFSMNKLSGLLRKKRMARGSINFDFPEAKIILDEKGRPVDIYKTSPTASHHIIEEFMLLCNEVVAQQFYWMEAPFVYRVHERPSVEKLQSFNDFLKNTPYRIKGGENVHPMEFAGLLKRIEKTPAESLISRVMLRSLMKAKYSDKNEGHFGLAFEYYCHFTSPIRRYPDLVIHRIIKEYLAEPPSAARREKLCEFVKSVAVHSSDAEIRAQDAEREIEDIKKAQYMLGKIGEEFNGIISSVVNSGMFVELENTVEGFVRVSDLKDDYYIFNETDLTLTGERTKKAYKIGDLVRIKVASVNTTAHEIDFVLADD